MKRIVVLLVTMMLLTACSGTTNEYKFIGESEHWEAEYFYSEIEQSGEMKADRSGFELNYKGSLEEMSSLQ